MIKPHGSDTLNPLYVQDDKKRAELLKEAEGLPSIVVCSAAAANAVMMGGGYFNPLTGYMNKADALGAAEKMQTASGLFFPVPILNMVEVTVATLLMDNPYIRNAGLLAADAVLRTELYGKRFREKDVDLLYPSVRLQAGLMDCIRGIKMGRTGSQAVRALQSAADELVNKGAQALIVACTELSIIADGLKVDARLYDSAQILAEAIVRTAR